MSDLEERSGDSRVWAQEGSTGFIVEIAQDALAMRGYRLKVTGEWTPETARAIKSVQRQMGGQDRATGLLDEETWQELTGTKGAPSLFLRSLSALSWGIGLMKGEGRLDAKGLRCGIVPSSLRNGLLTELLSDVEGASRLSPEDIIILQQIRDTPREKTLAILHTLRHHHPTQKKYVGAIERFLATESAESLQLQIARESLWEGSENLCEVAGKRGEAVRLAALVAVSITGSPTQSMVRAMTIEDDGECISAMASALSEAEHQQGKGRAPEMASDGARMLLGIIEGDVVQSDDVRKPLSLFGISELSPSPPDHR